MVRGEEIGQAEVEGEDVGERAVVLAARCEDLGHVARQRDLEPAVVAQEDVHGLAERAGPEEAHAAVIAPVAAPAADR